MTATDELSRMLDEHGVEWRRTPHYSSESIDNETVFRGEGIEWIANDHFNGHIGLRALRYEVTPEQAIEATLGSDLKAENEKLREQIETLVMYVEADGTRYWVDDDGNQHFDQSAVKDDADELRELVRDLYMALWTCNQRTCKHGNDGCYTEDGNSGGRCTLHDRMYELGVGV